MKKPSSIIFEEEFEVDLCPGLSLGDMLAHGSYDLVDEKLTAEWFDWRSYGKDEAILKLLGFDEDIKLVDAVKYLASINVPCAGIKELLAFGAELPEEIYKYDIYALNALSVRAPGYLQYVPVLSGDIDDQSTIIDLCEKNTLLPSSARVLIHTMSTHGGWN